MSLKKPDRSKDRSGKSVSETEGTQPRRVCGELLSTLALAVVLRRRKESR